MSASFSKNILLTLEYDGSDFLGWQDNGQGPSIERKLRNSIEKILDHKIKLQAASRTDAGVHAIDQKVNFTLTRDIPDQKLPRAINTHLPKSIRVTHAMTKPSSFHPTLDCLDKTYTYFLCSERYQLPFFRKTSWHIHSDLDLAMMQEAANLLLGNHDFTAFCTLSKFRGYEHHRCHMKNIQIESLEEGRLAISLQADRFLYRMARAIVGNLVAVGKSKISPDELFEILNRKERKLALMTAPAHGLFLSHVRYA